MRPGDVDDDRRRDHLAAVELDAGDVAVAPADRPHGDAEPERGAVVGGRMGEVVGGEHRVVDVAAVAVVEGVQLAAGVVGERRVVDRLRREVAAVVERREPRPQGGRIEQLVGDPGVVPRRQHGRAVVVRRPVDEVAGGHEPGHPGRVLDAEVAGPVPPAGRRLPRRQHGVDRRVAEADDRRRRARRAGTGRRALVDAHHPPPAPRQLEGDGGADDPGADDDGIGIAIGHPPSLPRPNRCDGRHVSPAWPHAPNRARRRAGRDGR